MRLTSVVVALLASAAFLLSGARAAQAHPLGNFTTNHLVRVKPDRAAVRVRYVLDLAEIPAFSVERGLDPNARPSAAALERWGRAESATILAGLAVAADGRPVPLTAGPVSVRERPGAAGLHTLYLTLDAGGALPAGTKSLTVRDGTYPGRLGWKDVVAGDTAEPTNGLTQYPAAVIGSPRARSAVALDLAEGRIAGTHDLAAVESAPDGSPSLARNDALGTLLARGDAGALAVLLALLVAIALGGLHALEPGHGKTLLAVSLVGARATSSQALILASALTVAHTAGVIALGLVVLVAAKWVVPEQIYPWITLLSGVLVAVIGARALSRALRRRGMTVHAHAASPQAHAHPHDGTHDHAHADDRVHIHPHTHDHAHPHDHPHDHDHAHGEHHHHDELDDEAHARAHMIPGQAPLSFPTAVAAAASGNIAPCPAALVVLLAAISLHKVAWGLAIVVAFGFGLAAVLTLLGIAVVRGAGWLSQRPSFDRLTRLAPIVSASVIALVGAVTVAQGFAAQGVGVPIPLVAALVALAIAGYALAPRHSHAPVTA
jgi:nickel/cobalt exporter